MEIRSQLVGSFARFPSESPRNARAKYAQPKTAKPSLRARDRPSPHEAPTRATQSSSGVARSRPPAQESLALRRAAMARARTRTRPMRDRMVNRRKVHLPGHDTAGCARTHPEFVRATLAARHAAGGIDLAFSPEWMAGRRLRPRAGLRIGERRRA